MATRIELGQDIKIKDPFDQEAKPNNDIFSKVGQKGEGFSPPLDALSEKAAGKEPVPGLVGKVPPRKKPRFLDENSGGAESPLEHLAD
jgi:hypothetical protein